MGFVFKKRGLDTNATVTCELYEGDEYMGSVTIRHLDGSSLTHKVKGQQFLDKLSKDDHKRYDEPRTDADRLFKKQVDVRFILTNYATDSKLEGDGEYQHDVDTLVLFFTYEGEEGSHGHFWDQVVEQATSASNYRRAKDEAAKNA